MKATYNWLKDFVDIRISARDLADKLTMAGLEVVSLEERAGDFILEIEVTSNRPDWLNVLGIAREISVITGAKLKQGAGKKMHHAPRTTHQIHIEDKKDCPLYTARIIRDVRIGPAPGWLRNRLELVGVRSVNNIVDITNYVLLELGEPLHAFDLDKLNPQKIIVRRARPGETILTIDEEERNLGSAALVIADQDRAVAIAGVMGGKATEVTFNTKNILLEAAVFNPIVIRRSRQALGLQSESSYRFERGVDPEMVQKASGRALELIQEYCGGKEVAQGVAGTISAKKVTVALDTSYAAKVLGIDIAPLNIKRILSGLGFKIRSRAQAVSAGVPSYRQDVRAPVDLVEEVARIFGYARIPVSLPAVKPDVTLGTRRDLVSEIKNILIGLGLTEAITFALVDKEGLNSFGDGFAGRAIEVMNPLSREQEVLRTTLMLGLGRSVAFNLNQKQDHVALFEIANIFRAGEKPCEELSLAVALSGARSFLSGQGLLKDEAGLLGLKGILETLLNRLGISDYEFSAQGEVRIQNEKIGALICLSPRALKELEIKNKEVFLLEVSLDKLLSFCRLNKRFIPLPRYP
ncbi:MAG: phenylalanine--tRNA ligase subunit beta, partial [Candidatus Omnitrophota bacterium]